MRYTPSPNNRRATVIMWGMIAAGSVVFCLQGAFTKARAALQAGAIILFSVGIYIAVRYLMTTFTYEIVLRTPDDLPDGVPAMQIDISRLPPEMLDLVVSRGVGQRPPFVTARMGMDELFWFGAVTRKDMKSAPPYKQYPTMRTYEYAPSLHPETLHLAVFLDAADTPTALLLELSPEMAGWMEGIRRE